MGVKEIKKQLIETTVSKAIIEALVSLEGAKSVQVFSF